MLDDPDLKTNPYTRFFELSEVKEYLGISFDGNGDITILPPRKSFDVKLRMIVKAFLNDDNFDTRTDPEDVLGTDFTNLRLRRPHRPKAADANAGAAAVIASTAHPSSWSACGQTGSLLRIAHLPRSRQFNRGRRRRNQEGQP